MTQPDQALPVWVGEGSPDWKIESQYGGNLTFEFGVVDMAASLARGGVEMFARQCLTAVVGGGYVTAGYWVAILWKRLMGASVLSAVSSDASMRVYAHSGAGAAGAITVLVLNIAESNRTVSVVATQPKTRQEQRPRDCSAQNEYHVTAAHSTPAGVLINGKPPAFVDGASQLPDFDALVSPCGGGVVVAPRSFAFIVLLP
jgi:hypothetical protein